MNNQPIPGILQQAAPLLVLASQLVLPIDLICDQPFIPQVGSIIGAPGPLENITFPMLHHQQFVAAQADDVYQHLTINMAPVLPQPAVVPNHLPLLHHFSPFVLAPPLPQCHVSTPRFLTLGPNSSKTSCELAPWISLDCTAILC